jgi:hypothetical protein
LNNGLVGWWTFDGKAISGVQAYDRSGNGNSEILTAAQYRRAANSARGCSLTGWMIM